MFQLLKLLELEKTERKTRYEKFGKTLVDTVIALLEGKNVDRLQMVEPVLVERESSGFASE